MRTKVNYKDIDLVVQGVYTKGEDTDREYPGSKSEFDIECIFVEDSTIDIFNLFSPNDITEIQDLILEKIE